MMESLRKGAGGVLDGCGAGGIGLSGENALAWL